MPRRTKCGGRFVFGDLTWRQIHHFESKVRTLHHAALGRLCSCKARKVDSSPRTARDAVERTLSATMGTSISRAAPWIVRSAATACTRRGCGRTTASSARRVARQLHWPTSCRGGTRWNLSNHCFSSLGVPNHGIHLRSIIPTKLTPPTVPSRRAAFHLRPVVALGRNRVGSANSSEQLRVPSARHRQLGTRRAGSDARGESAPVCRSTACAGGFQFGCI